MDGELKAVCEAFIQDSVAQLARPVLNFAARVADLKPALRPDNYVALAAESSNTFLQEEGIRKVNTMFLEVMRARLHLLFAKMRMYLPEDE